MTISLAFLSPALVKAALDGRLPRGIGVRRQGIVTKQRILKSGKAVGGIPFTRGPLAYLLRNRFYIGEVMFKNEVLPGEQPAILERSLFDAVQAKLTEQTTNHTRTRLQSEALLMGRLYDDCGNRMGPTHARKGGIKYRYYLSSALTDGRPEAAGSVSRVPAHEIEALVCQAVREHLELPGDLDDRAMIATHVTRVEVHLNELVIQIRHGDDESDENNAPTVICVPWQKQPTKRRREILLPSSDASNDTRPIRSETRATLIEAIARGRRWLNELTTDPQTKAETIAQREGCPPAVRKRLSVIAIKA
ncbi:MAG: recombinase family protein [Thermomicrobiales bacterium]|uniref:recombinase family protein n=1 Tax=Pseudorhodoplanes sp. TaxID=1934341 RepID=UPI003D0C7C12